MIYKPWPYQEYTTRRIVEGTCGPLLDMGLGKTVSTLTAIDALKRTGEVKRVLIIAPLRIADEVWSTEIEKWDHLRGLRISKVLGSEKRRKQALLKTADIYIINRENTEWLVAHYGGAFPFDMLVVDESSSFKDPSSKRFKALRKVIPLVKRKVILTGTPVPNGLLGLWSQVYILDRGKRLGERFTHYRDRYFQSDKRNGAQVYSYKIRQTEHADLLGDDLIEAEIYERVGDICFSMKASDYLDLPERTDITRPVNLGEKSMAGYLKFERDQVLSLAEEKEITAINAAALSTKLRQYANGAVYDENRQWHEVNTDKLESLRELVELNEGKPLLIFYSFQHDWQRIQHYLRKYNPVKFEGEHHSKAWNAGQIGIMGAHPGSAGHGLNLQAGGHIVVWFSLPWSLELYQQANGRIHRQGQTKPVSIYHLIASGTIDEDVMAALEGKVEKQEAMMAAVKARIQKYTS